MLKLPPVRLGRYEVIREIARSNDIVYEGWDPHTSRRVAIKQLQVPPGASTSQVQERVQRFEREARAAGALIHPNVALVFDQGKDRDIHYMVMEFLEGETLAAKLQREGKLKPREAAEIAVQLLKALEASHALGIVHRDVKPENVFVTPSGVKLADFGIARIAHEQALTIAGQVFGTPSYMAPEQVAGGQVDARSDLWAVGVVLFEMLTGTHPFQKGSVLETLDAVNKANPPFGSVTPVPLRELLKSAIEKDLTKRCTSAKAVRVRLEAFLDQSAHQPTASLPAQSISVASPVSSRPRQPWTLVSLVAIVAVGGFIGGRGTAFAESARSARRLADSVSSMANLIESGSAIKDLASDASYAAETAGSQRSRLETACRSVLGPSFSTLDEATRRQLVDRADAVVAKERLSIQIAASRAAEQNAQDAQRQALLNQSERAETIQPSDSVDPDAFGAFNAVGSTKPTKNKGKDKGTPRSLASTFTIGSTEQEVRAVQGPPSAVDTILDETHYSYAYSTVVFQDGGVVEYNDTSHNLKVSYLPGVRSKAKTFTIGSSQDEVLSVMGTPTSVDRIMDETHLSYSYSTIVVQDGLVKEYSDTSHNLRVR